MAKMCILSGPVRSGIWVFLLFLLIPILTEAQSDVGEVRSIVMRAVQPQQVVTFQLQRYLIARSSPLPHPGSAREWTAEADTIRARVLATIFHGWPKAWVNASPQFTNLGAIPGGRGFRRWKLLYQVVPGFYMTAMLYEPETIKGRVPGILVVMGHWPNLGNTEEFTQKQCINLALRGAIVLNPDWIDMGEFNLPENAHWFAAGLDLVGANGAGLFYLAMRRPLDYLCQLPQLDATRIGMTGLSGGGWQTIMLSSLDKRIRASIPVAGFTTLAGRSERVDVGEPGDLEQNAPDLLAGQDYNTFTAMLAPRPALLINNVGDDCCFRAPLVKPEIFDPVRRFFTLYGDDRAFQFHANTDDPAHNYGLDNRQQSYAFFIKWLGLSGSEKEVPVGEEIKSYADLSKGAPKENLTVLGLAKRMAGEITRSPIPAAPGRQASWAASEREKLRQVVRYQPVRVAQSWPVWNTWYRRVESVSYRFELSDGLSATGIWMKDVSTPPGAPLTIELNDGGIKAAGSELWNRVPEVADRLDRGEQVLALNLLFTGDAAPDRHADEFAEMVAATGARPVGLKVAQLLALPHWAQNQWQASRLRLEATGIRSQVQGLVAAALEPGLFGELATFGGMRSLEYLLQKPVNYRDAPDLFCLDLYKELDIDRLVRMAEPTKVSQAGLVALSEDGNP